MSCTRHVSEKMGGCTKKMVDRFVDYVIPMQSKSVFASVYNFGLYQDQEYSQAVFVIYKESLVSYTVHLLRYVLMLMPQQKLLHV